jgi:EAL domain-containing protein (putative c-di-GMP-specific phosphodiesterase class I)
MGPDGIEQAISRDEIGIATARIAGAVVRSAFQPIFEVRGNALEPVAVEGFARPYLGGATLPPRAFLSRLDERERRDAERICLVLHARNLPNIAEPGLGHVVALDDFFLAPSGQPDTHLLAEASRTAPAGSVGRLRATGSLGPSGHTRLSEALRGQGMLVSLGGFGAGASVWEDYRAARPEIVHLEGPWFRRVSANETALRLLAQLVRRLRDDGARVLVRGIETRQQLACAIAIGCDLFQGFVLARPALVGTVFDPAPRSVDLEDDIEKKIVSLFRG